MCVPPEWRDVTLQAVLNAYPVAVMDYDKGVLLTRLQSSLYLDYPAISLLEELSSLDLVSLDPFSGSVSGELAALQESLRKYEPEMAYPKLRDDYMRLFIGIGMPLAPLWSSVYLDEENFLMGESCRAVEEFMAQSGLACRLNDREPLDHLGLLLSALEQYLLRTAADQDRTLIRYFLQEFLLPWTPRCLELLNREAKEPFYRALGNLTSHFLDELAGICGAKRKIVRLYY